MESFIDSLLSHWLKQEALNVQQRVSIQDPYSPLKDLLMQADTNSMCQVIVSLHETNGLCIGGLTIDEQILMIPHEVERNANIVMLERYLHNIEYIKVETLGLPTIKNKNFTFSVKFFVNHYLVSILGKQFSYTELPTESDIAFLVSEFKKCIITPSYFGTPNDVINNN